MIGELRADQTVEADALLGRLQGQRSVHVGRDPDHELSAERSAGDWGGRGFPIVLHIDDGVLDDFAYPLKGIVGAFSQPAETRKLDTTSRVFLVILRPADSLVHLAENVNVQSRQGARTLRKWGRQAGRAVDLGWVDLRQDAAVQVPVVGVWAKGRWEPWCLAEKRK